MPRLVRRTPLWQRITSRLNPADFLLWLSEELETRDWDSQTAGTNFGLALNFIFLLARANSASSAKDDVFSDDNSYGWMSLLTYPLVWALVAFSATNAFYAMFRTRKYRLFEADVEVKPATPSARRVRVQSDPASPSVLRLITDLITPESAESRAYPDKALDVWELSVWDPLPISLQLFCLFGPLHVLVYLLFLPLAPLDPRPSVTVFNTLTLQAAVSGSLLLLSSRFARQAKDHSIIGREVLHEYDTKFVHPRLHPVVRDVGTQVSDLQPRGSRAFVQTGTPTTLIRRSFQTHANPNYTHSTNQVDSVNHTPEPSHHTNVLRPNLFNSATSTPPTVPRRSDVSATPAIYERKSSVRKSLPAHSTPAPVPSSVPDSAASHASPSKSGNSGFGGYMGVYSHHNSPLKKATSLNDINAPLPTNSREMAAYENRNLARASSPVKSPEARRSTGTITDKPENQFLVARRNRAQQLERYPSRW